MEGRCLTGMEKGVHMSPSLHDFVSTRQIGKAELSLILEGVGPYPVDLNVPQQVWRPDIPEADADGNISLCSSGAVLRLGDELIVIDPGLDDPGTSTSRAVKDVFRGWLFTPGFQAGLATLGVANEAVTSVVITHAHFDHCLGVAVESDGVLLPRFPNARHLLDYADWELHFTPDGDQRPLAKSPFAAVTRAMRERLLVVMRAGLLDLITDVHEVVPGVTTIPTPGETPGHRAVRIASDGTVCWHLGDLAHYAVEFRHLNWITPARRDTTAMLESREYVLPRLVAEDAIVTWSHASFPGWGRIIPENVGYRWQPFDLPII